MYRLIRFGTVSLEHYNQVDTVGTGVTPTAYQALPDGGALDNFGDQQKHPGAVERSISRRLRGTSQANLESLFLQLSALRGTRAKLFRRTVSGDIHWQYARLIELSAQRNYELTQYKLLQDIELRFVTQEATWRGDLGGVWYLDSGEYLDSGLAYDSGESYALDASPKSINIVIGTDKGRAPIRAVRIKVTAGNAPITAMTIARSGGESLTFSGTLAAGKSLVIDTGTLQVTNDGNDAYASMVFSPTANMAVWFSLQAGTNALTVTFSGGGTGSTIDFTYYEAWF